MDAEKRIILNGCTKLEDLLIKYMLSIANGMEDPRQKAFCAVDHYKDLRFKYYSRCSECACEVETGDAFCSTCGAKQ